MVQISNVLISVLIVLTRMVATGGVQLHEGKLSIIKREALLTADAVRLITIATPQHKIPNILTDKERKALSLIARSQSNIARDIQQCITEEPEELKEKLAESLEKLFVVIVQFEENFKGSFNNFTNTQFDRNNNIVVYIIYKLKYQATLFTKSNKELIAEMTKTVTQITKALDSLPCLNQATEKELIRFLQLGSIITERDAYKLQNWVEVNPHEKHDAKGVQDVIQFLGALYEKMINLIGGSYKVSHLKAKIISIYETSFHPGIQVTKVEYSENSGGQEFLRSSTFDVVTHGREFAENLQDILVKACKLHGH